MHYNVMCELQRKKQRICDSEFGCEVRYKRGEEAFLGKFPTVSFYAFVILYVTSVF
jgi:hypothetical protein